MIIQNFLETFSATTAQCQITDFDNIFQEYLKFYENALGKLLINIQMGLMKSLNRKEDILHYGWKTEKAGQELKGKERRPALNAHIYTYMWTAGLASNSTNRWCWHRSATF